MARSIGSIFSGFVLWTILWLGSNTVVTQLFPDAINADGSTDSAGLLVGFLILSVICSVLAGLVAARISTTNPARHAWILGGILLAVGVLVQVQYWDVMPLWYHLSFLALLVPATRYGAQLIRR